MGSKISGQMYYQVANLFAQAQRAKAAFVAIWQMKRALFLQTTRGPQNALAN